VEQPPGIDKLGVDDGIVIIIIAVIADGTDEPPVEDGTKFL